MRHLFYCDVCNEYTMKEECHGKTHTKKPPKYSVEDKLAQYRRTALEEERKQRGLL